MAASWWSDEYRLTHGDPKSPCVAQPFIDQSFNSGSASNGKRDETVARAATGRYTDMRGRRPDPPHRIIRRYVGNRTD